MENERTRIRINLTQREIEIEGSEKFLEKHQETIDQFIAEAKKSPSSNSRQPNTVNQLNNSNEEIKPKIVHSGSLHIPDSFGEFYTQVKRDISISDKTLVAGYYGQITSEDGLFAPKDVSALLNEQSVKVSNANAFVKSLLSSGKIYKQSGKYKVSENGVEYIKQLLAQS